MRIAPSALISEPKHVRVPANAPSLPASLSRIAFPASEFRAGSCCICSLPSSAPPPFSLVVLLRFHLFPTRFSDGISGPRISFSRSFCPPPSLSLSLLFSLMPKAQLSLSDTTVVHDKRYSNINEHQRGTSPSPVPSRHAGNRNTQLCRRCHPSLAPFISELFICPPRILQSLPDPRVFLAHCRP